MTTRLRRLRPAARALACAATVALLLGCAGGGSGGTDADGPDTPGAAGSGGSADGPRIEPRTVRVLANWLAEASQGGYWQAAADGLAEDRGVTIEGLSGGPGIATVTNVAVGEAEYGMTAADNLLVARAEGVPVVAVWGGMDVSPQCFMSHASAGVEDFADLSGLRISVSPAGTFWPVVQARYGIEPSEVLPVVDFGTFASDERIVRQCFATSERFIADREGWEVDFLMVHESGYQPYAMMLFTTEDRIRDHPEEVAAVVAAMHEGWTRFLDGRHQSGLGLILANNPDYTEEEALFAIEVMRDELFGDPLGDMVEARWEQTHRDLVDVGLVPEDLDWRGAFTREYLP
jgi:NitT/TauT family transport system substrate-binding protein